MFSFPLIQTIRFSPNYYQHNSLEFLIVNPSVVMNSTSMQLARKKHPDSFPPLPLARSFRIQFFGGIDFEHEADRIWGDDRGIQLKRIHALAPLQNTSWAIYA